MTLHTALLQGTKILEDGAITAPRLTAEVLLGHAIGRERVYLYAHSDEELTEVAWIHYGRYLHQRLNGKPTQYITKRQEFYGREFVVGPDVLIPRPETEHLVEASLAKIRPSDTVLDVGAGSGVIAITLALETRARVLATDISFAALGIAAANTQRLRAQVTLLACDLAACLADHCIDVLVSNPPYVASADLPVLQREVRDYEPHIALFAGASGLDIYERLIEQARIVLRAGGWMLLELGFNSSGPVQEMLSSDWQEIKVHGDLAGHPRVLEARCAP